MRSWGALDPVGVWRGCEFEFARLRLRLEVDGLDSLPGRRGGGRESSAVVSPVSSSVRGRGVATSSLTPMSSAESSICSAPDKLDILRGVLPLLTFWLPRFDFNPALDFVFATSGVTVGFLLDNVLAGRRTGLSGSIAGGGTAV